MKPSITDTFADGTVLITGSTGFLGKLLCDKLLRSCSLKTIAVLVRSKKCDNAAQRINSIFQQNIFDQLRKDKPDFMNFIRVIDGNIEESSLGLSSLDRKWLVENVNFIFHCAATIKFNETIKLATKTNVEGTKNLLGLATEIKNLKGFVHVSTAYSHCPRNEIKEQFYPISITAKELKNALDDDEPPLDVIEKWPNTYTFTKAITENMISTNGNHLPISIFRPSIVGCTRSEPIPGWLENFAGPPGLVTGIMVGITRAVLVDGKKTFDLVPADCTVNALISVMWDTVNRYNDANQINDLPKIYNYVSGTENPLTWGKFIEIMQIYINKYPPLCGVWYTITLFYTNPWVGKILRFWLHYLPAIFINLLSILKGLKPKMLKIYSKVDNLIDLYQIFTTSEWKYDNSHTHELWLSINQEDREKFPFSMKDVDWDSYIMCYFDGIRKYLLHEELDNLDRAKAKNKKLYYLHIFTVTFVVCCVFLLCWMILSCFL